MPILSKLPKWIWAGAFLLAFVAGSIDVVCILAATQTVSHMTGNNSEMAIQVANGDWAAVLKVIGVIGSFLIGAIISGYIIQSSTLKLGRRYGVALTLETALLLAATLLLHQRDMLGINLAACACGLQNAMVSTYSGAIIRTTHLTGLFTDLGILMGHRLRGLPIDTRRAKLFLLIISGFVSGALIAALAFPRFGSDTLLLAPILTAVAAIGYTLKTARSNDKPDDAPNAAA